jgi:hypothetical protein
MGSFRVWIGLAVVILTTATYAPQAVRAWRVLQAYHPKADPRALAFARTAGRAGVADELAVL